MPDFSVKALEEALRAAEEHLVSRANHAEQGGNGAGVADFLRLLDQAKAELAELKSAREILSPEPPGWVEKPERIEINLDTFPVAAAVLTRPDLVIRGVNAPFLRLLPAPEVNPVGRRFSEIFSLTEGYIDEAVLAPAFLYGKKVRSEMVKRVYPDGSLRYLNLDARPLTWRGQPAVLYVACDITERVTARQQATKAFKEAKRHKTEANDRVHLLDTLMQYVGEGIVILNAPDGCIQWISDQALRMLRQPRDALAGMTYSQFLNRWPIYHLDGMTMARLQETPAYRAFRKGERVLNEDWILRLPGEEDRIIRCSAGPIRGPGKLVVGAILTWLDVTYQRRVEQALRRRERRLRRFASYWLKNGPSLPVDPAPGSWKVKRLKKTR